MTKTTVFLTGATGTMGWAGLQESRAHKENYNIRVLARKSEKNIRKLGPLMQDIEVIWGDLTRYEDILKGVSGSDIVLHVGGMVSPQADYRPAATRKTNITAAEYLVKAVLAQEHQVLYSRGLFSCYRVCITRIGTSSLIDFAECSR